RGIHSWMFALGECMKYIIRSRSLTIELPAGEFSCFFFFKDPATTDIYALSLHDALPISLRHRRICPHQYDRGRLPHRFGRSCERSEEHTSELQSQSNLVCRLLLEKKNITYPPTKSGVNTSLQRLASARTPLFYSVGV